MKDSSELFLVDSNSLITPYESFYPFDFAKGFWDQIEQHIKAGSIAILDMTKNEVERGNDDLSNWMKTLVIGKFIDHREPAIIQKYSEILEYIQSHDCYKTSALMEWSKDSVADAWLIAVGSIYRHTVITFEKSNSGLNPRNPSKEAKIPDICSAFGVPVKNMFYMMRSLKISM